MCPVSDTTKYKLKLLNICLYIPVAQMSRVVFDELETLLSRKDEPRDISIHFRRIEIRPITIVKNKIEFYSDSLFPGKIFFPS
jgi:hypothetical protein